MSSQVKLPRLYGTNYQEWASIVKPLLLEEDVDISAAKLTSKVNAKALRIIRSTLSREILPSVMNIESALETWKILANTYSVVDTQKRKMKLYKLLSVEKQPGETLAQYFGRARLLCSEVNLLKLEEGNDTITEEVLMMIVIRGLPENLKNVVLKWSWKDLDLLTLETKLTEGITLNVQGHANHVGRKNKKKFKKKNVNSNTSISPIGEQGKSGTTNKSTKVCYRCGEAGHFVKFCSKKEPGQANSIDTSDKNTIWILDSGCSAHMTGDKCLLDGLTEIEDEKEFYLADDGIVKTNQIGKAEIRGAIKMNVNAYYLPNLKKNLLSVSQLIKDGYIATFDESGCTVSKEGKTCLTASLYNGVYILDLPELILSIHERLGHVNFKYLSKMGFKEEKPIVCKGCIEAEHIRKPYRNKTERTSSSLLEMIHVDLCGPLPVQSFGGSKYFMVVVDDYSRFSYVYFLAKKSEAFSKIKEFIAEVENLHTMKVKQIKSDCGGEFKSAEFSDFCKEKGIVHKFTSPYAHQENGVAERMNRTLMKKARSMMFMKNQDTRLWAEAIECANYLRNITYCATIERTPFEIWFNKKPSYDKLKIWVV